MCTICCVHLGFWYLDQFCDFSFVSRLVVVLIVILQSFHQFYTNAMAHLLSGSIFFMYNFAMFIGALTENKTYLNLISRPADPSMCCTGSFLRKCSLHILTPEPFLNCLSVQYSSHFLKFKEFSWWKLRFFILHSYLH